MNGLAVHDDCFDSSLVRAAAAEWPADDWEHWVRYDTPQQRKLLCDSWAEMAPAIALLLGEMFRSPVVGVTPDGSLRAAGMGSMGPNDFVRMHLDADRHGVYGWERRLNTVLYLDEWEEDWGGVLEFRDGAGNVTKRVLPQPNRLVIFNTTDTSYHRVELVTCPENVRRKSLSVFWYAPAPLGKDSTRPRAQFVPERLLGISGSP